MKQSFRGTTCLRQSFLDELFFFVYTDVSILLSRFGTFHPDASESLIFSHSEFVHDVTESLPVLDEVTFDRLLEFQGILKVLIPSKLIIFWRFKPITFDIIAKLFDP